MNHRVVILVSYSSLSLPLKDMNMFSLQNFYFHHRSSNLFQLLSRDLPPIHMGKLLKVFLCLCIVLNFTPFSYRHVHPKIPLLFPLLPLLFNQQASHWCPWWVHTSKEAIKLPVLVSWWSPFCRNLITFWGSHRFTRYWEVHTNYNAWKEDVIVFLQLLVASPERLRSLGL